MAKQVRTVQRARRQRREMSLPEVMLWQRLRGAPEGIRFRRQHPFGLFVLDFYCAQAKLAIEVDGIVHTMGDQPAFDDKRRMARFARDRSSSHSCNRRSPRCRGGG